MRLHDFLDWRAREKPNAEFAVQGDRTLSYADAKRASRQIAAALAADGLEIGDRIAVLSKNSIEMALLYYAASRVGVVPVPLNYRLAPAEWAFIIDDSEAKLLVGQPELCDALSPVRDELKTVKRFLSAGGSSSGWDDWSAFVDAAPAEPPEREITREHDVYQMYTSGTTGRPKGAVITQAALSAQLHQANLAFGALEGQRSLIVAPLYHAAAAMTTFATVMGGGSLYIHEDFNPADVVTALSEERIGMALLVPVMIQFCMLAVPDAAKRKYDDLQLIIYGASPIAEATLRQGMETFGCDFLQGYGMTETTAAATYLMPDDHRRAMAGETNLLLSAGRPLVGTEVRVVDSEDRAVPNGTIGEVVIRGPQLMQGYWKRKDASEEALRGGWMHTGDAGIIDDEGFLYIQDRVKDMIVSGGENVYPREIEDVLFEHPAVGDAAVIGVPDEKWGETVKAVIVVKEGEPADADAILEHCRQHLGGYKVPRSIDFVDELPRNPSGKVMKKDLREKYWQGHSRRVS